MTIKLLQMNYLSSGSWGDELVAEYTELAHRIADVLGLICKVMDGKS